MDSSLLRTPMSLKTVVVVVVIVVVLKCCNSVTGIFWDTADCHYILWALLTTMQKKSANEAFVSTGL